MICIYHSRDLDGWMSGAIVKLHNPNVKLIAWDYGQPLPQLNPETEDEIVMVDISFPKGTMDAINELFYLEWIDHHASAIKEMDGIDIHGLRDSTFAACELTWKYYFPQEEMPEIVRLLGRYDCFGHKGTEEEIKVLEFQYGARTIIDNVDEAYKQLVIARGRGDWSFDTDLCDDILLQGKAIYRYLCTEAKQIYNRKFDIDLDGYKFGCVNECRFNPVNFGIDYHNDGYDGFACFHFQDGQYMYSLYNDNKQVDCSLIAKAKGGGGHKGASGFRSPIIIR